MEHIRRHRARLAPAGAVRRLSQAQQLPIPDSGDATVVCGLRRCRRLSWVRRRCRGPHNAQFIDRVTRHALYRCPVRFPVLVDLKRRRCVCRDVYPHLVPWQSRVAHSFGRVRNDHRVGPGFAGG